MICNSFVPLIRSFGLRIQSESQFHYIPINQKTQGRFLINIGYIRGNVFGCPDKRQPDSGLRIQCKAEQVRPVRRNHAIVAPSDPDEGVDCTFPQKRLWAVKERSYGRHRILYRLMVDEAHLAQQPERLCLYFYGVMGEERRNMGNALFPSAFVSMPSSL